jgi:hypothetical protein
MLMCVVCLRPDAAAAAAAAPTARRGRTLSERSSGGLSTENAGVLSSAAKPVHVKSWQRSNNSPPDTDVLNAGATATSAGGGDTGGLAAVTSFTVTVGVAGDGDGLVGNRGDSATAARGVS